eukprot:366445-Chlamydomonas_euryale.AAC.19
MPQKVVDHPIGCGDTCVAVAHCERPALQDIGSAAAAAARLVRHSVGKQQRLGKPGRFSFVARGQATTCPSLLAAARKQARVRHPARCSYTALCIRFSARTSGYASVKGFTMTASCVHARWAVRHRGATRAWSAVSHCACLSHACPRELPRAPGRWKVPSAMAKTFCTSLVAECRLALAVWKRHFTGGSSSDRSHPWLPLQLQPCVALVSVALVLVHGTQPQSHMAHEHTARSFQAATR